MQYLASTDRSSDAHETALPDIYMGAWRRQSLAYGGRQPFEDSNVIWLQTRGHFADLRTPLRVHDSNVRCSAFSGMTLWESPRITFLRDLDLSPTPVDDGATLELVADDQLIERGNYRHEGRDIPYEEVWRRVATPRGPIRVLDGRLPDEQKTSMRLVQIGDIAMVMLDERAHGGDFTATQFMRDEGEWRPENSIGSAMMAPPPEATFDCLVAQLTPQSADLHWARRCWSVQEFG